VCRRYCVRRRVRSCVRACAHVIAQCVRTQWRELHHTLVDVVVEATEELIRGQNQGRFKVKHLSELLRRADGIHSDALASLVLVLVSN